MSNHEDYNVDGLMEEEYYKLYIGIAENAGIDKEDVMSFDEFKKVIKSILDKKN